MAINSIKENILNYYNQGTTAKNNTATSFAINEFAEKMRNIKEKSDRDVYIPVGGQNGVHIEPYQFISSAKEYSSVETDNYFIKAVDNERLFEIYNKEGDKLGVFFYDDIYIRKDLHTGKELLISSHGTASYSAMILNNELKIALSQATGNNHLQTKDLTGFTLLTHSGTGIQYLLRDGEVGKGGKTLIQNADDQKKFDTLVDEYLTKYSNLIRDKQAAAIHADLEIRGLMMRTPNGIINITYDSISYNDNMDATKNWAVIFHDKVKSYQYIMKMFEKINNEMIDKELFRTWEAVLNQLPKGYERIWSDTELKQGYLYQ